MPPPALLLQHTGANLRDYLRAITATALDFSPTEMINTMVTPDRAVNAISANHLLRQPGSARRHLITEFGTEFALWGLYVEQWVSGSAGQGAWVCPTVGAWSGAGSQAVITVMRLDREGIGGYFLGCLKGPHPGAPFNPLNLNLGTYRGLALASHGGGQLGMVGYGDEGLGDQSARLYRPNLDQNAATPSRVGGFRITIHGYDPNLGGAGVGGGYLWVGDNTSGPNNQCCHEFYDCDVTPGDPVDDPEGSDPSGAVGSSGDLSSPDGRFAFGSVETGVNATIASGQFINYVEGVLAHCSYFTGAAADSIHLHKTTICNVVQADIDARTV